MLPPSERRPLHHRSETPTLSWFIDFFFFFIFHLLPLLLTVSLTPAQRFRPPAKNGPCSPSVARLSHTGESVPATVEERFSSCLCHGSRKKKQTSEEPNATPSVQRTYRDVKKGQTAKTRATKDGEMVVYVGAGAAVATAAVVAGTSGCGGGDGCGGGGCRC
ncbi:hypothetical protein FH972_008185 [Carpinus fangiana]|uniref:Uncharacterized protein n=1 Tax=Carpinus fangiana TaxID=176857 RepID=A0A5N6QXW0_9ROSI|nr:hypothetical protein FH972_008185 [Carpinus fangiana]